MIRHFIWGLLALSLFAWVASATHPTLVTAQTVSQLRAASASPSPATDATLSAEVATQSGEASLSAQLASISAQLEQRIQEKQDKDITQSTAPQKSKLAAWLDENPIGPLSWHNFLQHPIREAINRGLPANIVVLVLLFPVIAAFISFTRHIIGMKGFGIYIPAVLSVAFVSTGIINGIVLFMITLLAALTARQILKRLKLHYLPRTALLLWGVSIVVLLALISSVYLPGNFIAGISIFPLLIIMLLTENFMESQLTSSQSATLQLTFETLITAVLCSIVVGSEFVQKGVILQPELTLLGVAAINIVVGRYTGLRLLEWLRFKSIIEE